MRQPNQHVRDRRTLDGLILDLYAAPANADAWLTFLHGLCTATRGSAVSLISHDLRSQKASVSLTTLTDADAIGQYNDRWAAADPWAHSRHLAQTVGITHMNTAASRLVQARDGLLVDGRGAPGRYQWDTSRLRTLMAKW